MTQGKKHKRIAKTWNAQNRVGLAVPQLRPRSDLFLLPLWDRCGVHRLPLLSLPSSGCSYWLLASAHAHPNPTVARGGRE